MLLLPAIDAPSLKLTLTFIKLLESPIPTAAAAAAAPPAPPSQKAHFALCIAPSVVP